MIDRDFSQAAQTIERSEGPANQQETLTKVLTALAEGNGAAFTSHLCADAELHIFGFAAVDGSWQGKPAVTAAVLANLLWKA